MEQQEQVETQEQTPTETPAESQQEQQTPSQTGGLAARLLESPPQSSEAPASADPADPWETDAWKDLLRPDFKDADGNVNVKALAKAYKGAEARISAGDIPPKDETGYKVEVQYPEGVQVNPERQTSFLKGAHAKGMTNAQVNWVLEQHANLIAEAQQMQAGQAVNAEQVLKSEWGEAFDRQMQAAQKAFHLVADDKDKANVDQIGNNPAIVRLLAKLGNNLKEDPGLPPEIYGMSPEDVEALQKSEAYWNPKHPEHSKVKQKVTQYYQTKGRRTAA